MKALVAYSNNATELGSRELRIIVLAGRMVKLGSQGLGAQRAGVSVLEWASRSWSGRAGVGVLEPSVYCCIVLPCAILYYVYMLIHCVTLCYIVLCSNKHGVQHLIHGALRVDPGAP